VTHRPPCFHELDVDGSGGRSDFRNHVRLLAGRGVRGKRRPYADLRLDAQANVRL
jgi:hypothetical protein